VTVSAIVVNYNTGDHLLHCVRSLHAAGVSDVTVVDNMSTDRSVETLTSAVNEVRVRHSGANLGYGGGVNRGLPESTGDFVLVLNADVLVDPNAVDVMVAVLDANPDVGIVGPRIEELDGSLYPSARAFPHLVDAVGHAFVGLVTTDNRFSRRYLMTDWDHAASRDVDWVSGACFLARRSVLTDIQGFDESYFMYLEDVDLCWRAGNAGWTVRYEPAAHVTHVQGVSTAQTPYRMLAAHHRSLMRYWWRTTSWPGRLLAPVVAGGLLLRLALMAARRGLSSLAGGPLRGGPSGR
jgi:N-acetylglucosaminyl-diphospho-decaprenol L-rhamnosyltransferase